MPYPLFTIQNPSLQSPQTNGDMLSINYPGDNLGTSGMYGQQDISAFSATNQRELEKMIAYRNQVAPYAIPTSASMPVRATVPPPSSLPTPNLNPATGAELINPITSQSSQELNDSLNRSMDEALNKKKSIGDVIRGFTNPFESKVEDGIAFVHNILGGASSYIRGRREEQESKSDYRDALVNTYQYAEKGLKVQSPKSPYLFSNYSQGVKLKDYANQGTTNNDSFLSPEVYERLKKFIIEVEGHPVGSKPKYVMKEKTPTTAYGLKYLYEDDGSFRPVSIYDVLDKRKADYYFKNFMEFAVLQPVKEKYPDFDSFDDRIKLGIMDSMYNAGQGAVLQKSPKLNALLTKYSKTKASYLVPPILAEINIGSDSRVKARNSLLYLAEGGVASAAVEVEDGEYIQLPDGTVVRVDGRTHDEGGETLALPEGAAVVTDQTTIGGDFAKSIRDMYGINVKFNNTYADCIDKYRKKLNITEVEEELADIEEELKEQGKVKDEATKNLNMQFLQSKYEEKVMELQKAQTMLSAFTEAMFQHQEKRKGKAEFKSENIKLAKGGYIDKNKLAELALENNVSLERAYELLGVSIPEAEGGLGVEGDGVLEIIRNIFSNPELKESINQLFTGTQQAIDKTVVNTTTGMPLKIENIPSSQPTAGFIPGISALPTQTQTAEEAAAAYQKKLSPTWQDLYQKAKDTSALTKPADPADPAKSAKPADPADPAKSAKSAKSADQDKSAEQKSSIDLGRMLRIPPSALQLTKLDTPNSPYLYPVMQSDEAQKQAIYTAQQLAQEQLKSLTSGQQIAGMASIASESADKVSKVAGDVAGVNQATQMNIDQINANIMAQLEAAKIAARDKYTKETLTAMDKTREDWVRYAEVLSKDALERQKAENTLAMYGSVAPNYRLNANGEIVIKDGSGNWVPLFSNQPSTTGATVASSPTKNTSALSSLAASLGMNEDTLAKAIQLYSSMNGG